MSDSNPNHSSDRRAAIELAFERSYDDLRVMAASLMRAERQNHTLTPTAIVHEAYLSLVDQRSVPFDEPSRFKALVALFLRRTLSDYGRRTQAAKRSKPRVPEAVDQDDGVVGRLLELNEALELLRQTAPDQAQLVELRFFGGMSIEETAREMGVSPRTVDARWKAARAVLSRHLGG